MLEVIFIKMDLHYHKMVKIKELIYRVKLNFHGVKKKMFDIYLL
jgi:hypothetical protein